MSIFEIIATLSLVITHSTVFHADDVFGVALMRLLKPGIEVIRTVDKTYIGSIIEDVKANKTLIFDLGCVVGLLDYDHHQPDELKQYRPEADGTYIDKNGKTKRIPYCGAGLLWKRFGSILCPNEKAFDRVDKTLFLPVDKADNGVETNVLSTAISQYNPSWKETFGKSKEEVNAIENKAFWEAEAFAEATLRNIIKRCNDAVEAEELLLASRKLDEGQILILDQYLPWETFIATDMPKVKFCIYPGKRDPWNIQKAPVAPGSFEGRCHFPQRWLGNPDKNLGMGFCHPNNFLATADTLEHAINIARVAIGEYQKEQAYQFLLSGYKHQQVLTISGNIHLLVKDEEYVWVWADGEQKRPVGWYEDHFNGVFLDEGLLKDYVFQYYKA